MNHLPNTEHRMLFLPTLDLEGSNPYTDSNRLDFSGRLRYNKLNLCTNKLLARVV